MSGIHRHIAHFDMDTFFVSVEVLKNPRLKGKPLIVGGDGRGVVTSCSYETRKFQVRSGMPTKFAKRLCPEAIIIKGDFESYAKYSRLVTEIVKEKVPVFEKASIDEFYIDLTGTDKYVGSLALTKELKSKIARESGLPVSWGLASNKLISKVAANKDKPNAQLEIPFGNEKLFLAPLPVAMLPGVGKETAEILYDRKIKKVGVLAQIPVEILEASFGKTGVELSRRANGIDESQVIPYHEQKSISTEHTFQNDTIDMNFLHAALVRMTEAVAFSVRNQNRLTGCVTVKIKYSDFNTVSKQRVIAYTNDDLELLQITRELFDRLYDRRILIRLVGVRFSDLIPGTYQVKLYEDTQERINLNRSIDSIKKRFGEKLIIRASGFDAFK